MPATTKLTENDVLQQLQHYEYENPTPLSKTPSVALRQIIADVRHVVLAGASLDMSTWGRMRACASVNKVACEVCLAGAVLLSRRHYHNTAISSWLSIGRGAVSLHDNDSLWGVDPVASAIADALNDLRRGWVYAFMCDWCGLPDHVAESLETGMPRIRAVAGRLSSADVDVLLTDLGQLADYFQLAGY